MDSQRYPEGLSKNQKAKFRAKERAQKMKEMPQNDIHKQIWLCQKGRKNFAAADKIEQKLIGMYQRVLVTPEGEKKTEMEKNIAAAEKKLGEKTKKYKNLFADSSDDETVHMESVNNSSTSSATELSFSSTESSENENNTLSTTQTYKCPRCSKKPYKRYGMYKLHLKTCGVPPPVINVHFPGDINRFHLLSTAMGKRFVVYRADNLEVADVSGVYQDFGLNIQQILKFGIDKLKLIKAGISIQVEMVKESLDGSQFVKPTFTSTLLKFYPASDIMAKIGKALSEIDSFIDQYTQKGSGWSVARFIHCDVIFGLYKPHKGGCRSIQLPNDLKNKKCLISPDTISDCFMYSVLAGLHTPQYNPQRVTLYRRYLDLYDFSDVRGNVSVHQIKKFTRKNAISVNVYSYDVDSKTIWPIKVMDKENTKHVNLLLYNDHYFTITNFNRLASTSGTRNNYFCYRCICSFNNQERLDAHRNDCLNHTPQKLVLPQPGSRKSVITRNDYRKESRFPYIIYGDFETLSTNRTDSEKILADLVPVSYALIAVDWNRNIVSKKLYFGENVRQQFFKSLADIKKTIDEHKQENFKPLSMSPLDEQEFEAIQNCHICGKCLGHDRVRDHDHLTGQFRGPAHQACNVAYQVPSKIPVIFHNLKNFDGHIIIGALRSGMFKNPPRLIPHTMEKYIAFMLDDFIFLDSYSFLPASLDNLAQSVPDDIKKHFMTRVFPENTPFELLMKKACLPYEYFNSISDFDLDHLPSKEAFYSTLTDSHVTDEMYDHVTNIWNRFNCQTLKDFHNIYLKVDTSLLAAIFENFRRTSFRNFGIDPCHYFSAPGFAWAAAIKKTKIKLELITDNDMLLMVEKGIRGGLTQVSKRHVIANNTSCPNYDSTKEPTSLAYFDVNNLYGYSMCQELPVGEFSWVPAGQFINVIYKILDIDDSDLSSGFILEVDLEYPDNLHDKHNDYPLAPYKQSISDELLSPYQKAIAERLAAIGNKSTKVPKLVTTFLKREKYVVHGKTLYFYLKEGMKLKKIHRIIRFKQAPWLKPYVEFCTEQRKQSSTNFEKDFWKLMVNSIYGKTIEDKRKHTHVELVLDNASAEKRLRDNTCENFLILDEDRILFKMKRKQIIMDKPIAIGFTVLELSKMKMYDLHYNHFKATYGNNINLVYTDTDSFIYEVKNAANDHIIARMHSILDTSNYPREHRYFQTSVKRKLAFKDELSGGIMFEFIGLKSKLYAYKSDEGEKKRAKGVNRAAMKRITFDDYKKAIDASTNVRLTMHRLQAVRHEIQLLKYQKLCITPFDNKRYIREDGISTLAYGHYSLRADQ
ncbi:uncharacterized protein LOC128392507 [Panonychus citri]|uniref:uncharacterized protein LOC128392507 n=1 Tax=Panonychus citri TaxID=50023 RepID=UPI00230773F8|nr:uncharacterized protein LOC128392507 [Panonychus citri]